MRVLVVNAGSSSVKLRLLDSADQLTHSADIPAAADGFDQASIGEQLLGWPTPDAVGHRVVHGGTLFTGPTVLDDEVRAQLAALTALAPLHQPKSLAALDAITSLLPAVPAVASFDTAFHTSLSAAAYTYAIPREWRERYGIRRYGFHGLSHAYASARAAEMLGRPVEQLRVVTCHLGAGASLAAVVDGRSVDTTMGFTPLEGLVMATRSGSVDPGIALWLVEHQGLSPHEVSTALAERSGLSGLGGSGDMREIETAAAQGNPGAQLAIEVYTHRLVTGIGAMSAAAGGLDALVFTGGVGENSALVRRRAAERLGHLGVAIDDSANLAADGDCDLSDAGASASTVVVAAREDLQIAREARLLLGRRDGR